MPPVSALLFFDFWSCPETLRSWTTFNVSRAADGEPRRLRMDGMALNARRMNLTSNCWTAWLIVSRLLAMSARVSFIVSGRSVGCLRRTVFDIYNLRLLRPVAIDLHLIILGHVGTESRSTSLILEAWLVVRMVVSGQGRECNKSPFVVCSGGRC